MDKEFFEHIGGLLQEQIKNITPLSGGDISRAYKIKTDKNFYFAKVNRSGNALQMFQSEQNGLETIRSTRTIAVPQVFACGVFREDAFLLTEFVERKVPFKKDYEALGTAMALLHQQTGDGFGLGNDNFIGNLQQSNRQHDSWTDFYVKERLLPQLNLAVRNNLLKAEDCPDASLLINVLRELFGGIKPSLLHGDFWNGNFIVAKDGTPYLIDPAVYYGHCEVDIAMSKLFGGFDGAFYEAHARFFPEDSSTADRTNIYQLYYLLVHLNLFGDMYYGAVKSLLVKYF